ncbi:MAG: hypothetical protein MJZ05_02845 [Fibrobacter sp.]|nr:hypothetical protein [Fibrobacter sp.]
MKCNCKECGKEFTERVGMSPMESNMAMRVRNKLGHICPECQNALAETKKGRRKLAWWNFRVACVCGLLLLPVFAVFAALIAVLGLYVL